MRRLGIIIPTHDRAASLRRTLQSVLEQTYAGPPPEIVVVNNNSSDGTAAVGAELAPRIRMIDEPRQGLSHARNTGIQALGHFDGDDIMAFIDDDIEAQPGWIGALAAAFEAEPSVDCVGGRVLASEPDARPSWLTQDHWAPLTLQDHGARRRIFDERTPVGLIGANVVRAWLKSLLTGDGGRAFAAETRLWFFSGFVTERCVCLARR